MAAVAVDFDGVIHRYSRGWADGTIYDPPLEGSGDALRELMKDYAVFIHTTRDADTVAKWISRQFYIDTVTYPDGYLPEFWNRRDAILVTNRKLPAIAYIDDRAIRFRFWDQALEELAFITGRQ